MREHMALRRSSSLKAWMPFGGPDMSIDCMQNHG